MQRCHDFHERGDVKHQHCLKKLHCHHSYTSRSFRSWGFNKDQHEFSVCLDSINDQSSSEGLPIGRKKLNIDLVISIKNQGKSSLYVGLSRLDHEEFCKAYIQECRF